MAINRTPFNALIDDPGSGTLGTPWNKTQIAGVLLDPIDAMWLTVSSDIVLTNDGGIRRNTASGSDTGYVQFGGGGDMTSSRGATLLLSGNQRAGAPGYLLLTPGTVAGSKLRVPTPIGNALEIDGATGATTFLSSSSSAWIFNSTNASGGHLAVQHSGTNSVTIGSALTSGVSVGTINDAGINAPGGSLILRSNSGIVYANSYFHPWQDNTHFLGATTNRWSMACTVRLYVGTFGTMGLDLEGATGLSTFRSNITTGAWIFSSTNAEAGFMRLENTGGPLGYIGNCKQLVGNNTAADLCIRAVGKLTMQSDANLLVAFPVYNGTDTAAANVTVDSNGTVRRSTSSRRYKRDITPLDARDRARILQLQPVAFTSVDDGRARIGLIAEDVTETEPRLSEHGDDVAYTHLTAGLLAVIQDMHARLTALERITGHDE